VAINITNQIDRVTNDSKAKEILRGVQEKASKGEMKDADYWQLAAILSGAT